MRHCCFKHCSSLLQSVGCKTAEDITARCLLVAEFLLNQGIKALIVACNTATSAAVQTLRSKLIEKGDLLTEQMKKLLLSYLQPLLDRGVDTLVPGCTHYPFVLPLRFWDEKLSLNRIDCF